MNIACSQAQVSGWLAAFNTIRTGKSTSIHADVQWRSGDNVAYTQTLLLRTGLNYHLNKRSTITAGYAFIHNYRSISDVDGYLPEHRIWEQYLYAHKVDRISISHRFRLEQRFLPAGVVDNDQISMDGSLFANRFRYFTRAVLPLQKGDSFDKGLFAALQNEVLLNIGNKQHVNGKTFDQNRFYIAAGYRLNKKFDLEAGYLNQFVEGRTTGSRNHVAQIASYLRL